MARHYKFGVWYEGAVPDEQATWYMYHNAEREAQLEIAHKFREFLESYKARGSVWYDADNPHRFKFDVIKKRELIETWDSFVRHGKANREMVEKFEEQMINNIARLDVLNALSGHDVHDGWSELREETDVEFTEDEQQVFYDSSFANHDTEGAMLSDYGLTPLQRLVTPLLTAATPERKLVVIDKMLNVCHMRGDLAAFFVEGGSRTLNELAREEEEELAYV